MQRFNLLSSVVSFLNIYAQIWIDANQHMVDIVCVSHGQGKILSL